MKYTPQVAREKLLRCNNNMDFVCYVLAMSVLIAHFNTLCGGDISWPISSATAVGGFFTMSGFLVYGSYERHPQFKRYVQSRALRILPPYVFIVLLCAVGLVAVSSLDASEFFGSAQWWRYLAANLSFLNFLEPSLPGVFNGSEYHDAVVNGSLWTMKVEWCLYLSVPIVAWMIYKLRGEGKVLLFSSIIIMSLVYKMWLVNIFELTGRELYLILERQFFGQLAYFYLGVVIYQEIEVFMRYRYVILVGLLVLLLLRDEIPYYSVLLQPVVDGGLVMCASLIGTWGRYFSQHDNVSYDMYLFHFPILQLGVYFGLVGKYGEWVALGMLSLATVVLSILSWNLIGRRAIALRSRV